MRHILKTFFDGSAEQAISALLDENSSQLSPAELDRLARLIDSARKSGV
jgi:DNA-binding MurR/RpiR family transcriptional regulator